MYERSYGYKYEEQKGLTSTDVAKKIRADIKLAVKEGMLPADWKYSVRRVFRTRPSTRYSARSDEPPG